MLITIFIHSAQLKAALAINQELILLYWLEQEILKRQQEEGWGAKVINRLAKALKIEFPGMTGLSSRNIGYMKPFSEAYPNKAILAQLGAKIP